MHLTILLQSCPRFKHINYYIAFFIIDDVWDVFLATEVIPKYQGSVYLTVDDAVAAANASEPSSPTPEKVGDKDVTVKLHS